MRGLGFTNPVGTGGVLDVYLCFGCGGVGEEWVEEAYVPGRIYNIKQTNKNIYNKITCHNYLI